MSSRFTRTIAAAAFMLPWLGLAQTATLSVTPNPAPAAKTFTLHLNGVQSTCGNTFSRESVTVTNNRIDLTYEIDYPIYALPQAAGSPDVQAPVCPMMDAAASSNPAIVLPPIMLGPSYNMPALKAGNYEVWATQVYACQFSQPACMIKTAPVSAGTLVVSPDTVPTQTFTLDPTQTDAGKAFDLRLLSYQWDCATVFDSAYATVSGNVITLNYQVSKKQLGIVCPAIYAPYGPTFKIPALAQGTYTVNAWDLTVCAPPPRSVDCRAMMKPEFTGTLTVTAPIKRPGWFLKDREVPPAKAFSMQLLNNDYGNCGTTFPHANVSVTGNDIYTSFTIQTDSSVRCITNITPWGPSFDMQALNAGAYPVYVTVMPGCLYTKPMCAIAMPAPTVADTLLVTKTSSVLLSQLRAQGLSAGFEGARVAFDVPEGSPTWKAELVTLQGRRIAVGSVNGRSGTRARLDLGAKPQRGVYLLRLEGANGVTRLLPVVRGD